MNTTLSLATLSPRIIHSRFIRFPHQRRRSSCIADHPAEPPEPLVAGSARGRAPSKRGPDDSSHIVHKRTKSAREPPLTSTKSMPAATVEVKLEKGLGLEFEKGKASTYSCVIGVDEAGR